MKKESYVYKSETISGLNKLVELLEYNHISFEIIYDPQEGEYKLKCELSHMMFSFLEEKGIEMFRAS